MYVCMYATLSIYLSAYIYIYIYIYTYIYIHIHAMTPVREPGLRNTVPMSPESVGEVALAAKALTSESGAPNSHPQYGQCRPL